MNKHVEGPAGFHHHYPKLAVIVTSSAKGKDNAMAVAWFSSVSQKPPLMGISVTSKRFTYEQIMESGEFGINFISLEKAELIAGTGGCSGRDVDKYERFNLEKEQPLVTNVPILKDAYAAYECKLVANNTYGDHQWLVGEVVATHYDEGFVTPDGHIDLTAVNPAIFMGAELYYSTNPDAKRHLVRAEYGKGLGV
jgi:flavin reductase (DIM6/NTAB) family NADH-FMN oxidoreductase RutF